MKISNLLQLSCAFLLFSSQALSQSVTIDLNVVGLTENQQSANVALQNSCASVGANPATAAAADLLVACNLLLGLDEDDVALALGLNQLTPEEIFAISDSVTFASDTQISNVNLRLNTIRSITTNTNLARVYINDDQNSVMTGGAAAFELGDNGFEVFASGQLTSGDIEGEQLQQSVDFSTNSFNVGVDKRFTDNFVSGVSFGFFQHESDFTDSAGKVEVDSFNVALFGTFFSEKYGFVDGVLDIGGSEFEMIREIAVPGLPVVNTIGSTDSSNFSLTIGVGKYFNWSAWELGPYARVGYVSSSVDGYREQIASGSPGSGLALGISSQTINSTTFTLGAAASRVVSTSKAVLVPQISLEMELEADSEKDPFSAFFLADPGQTVFSVAGDDRDSSYANLGLGATAVFTNGRSAYAFYQSRLAHSQVTQDSVNLGVRFEF